MFELIAAIVFVLVMSALCSCTEAAIFSLPLTKARHLAEKSNNGKVVCQIREHPARPISVIVLFNNLFNIAGTFVIAHFAAAALSATAQTWFPFALTAAVIVLSEIIPKTVGERFSTPIACLMARPVSWITWLCTPLVIAIEWLVYLFIGRRTRNTVTETEIQALSKIGHQEGMIDEAEHRMIVRVFELDDRLAVDIMTPRTAVSHVKANSTLKEIIEVVAASEHSRLLAIGDTPDEVKGILLKSTVLWMISQKLPEDTKVLEYLKPVKLFKEDTSADDLLDYFKSSKVHLAVVIDEYGGVSGIVTLEDVLEVLTGEIMDETDKHEDMQQVALAHGRRKLEKQQANRLHEKTNCLTKQ